MQGQDTPVARPAEAEPPIRQAVDRLDTYVAKLESLIGDLNTVLTPVRNNSMTQEAPNTIKEAPSGSPLAQQLGEILSRVQEAQGRVQRIIQEIEV